MATERTPDEIRNEAMADFTFEAPVKYDKGQSEHGGNLDSVGVLELIRRSKEEVIDQWFYLCSAEEAYIMEREVIESTRAFDLATGSTLSVKEQLNKMFVKRKKK